MAQKIILSKSGNAYRITVTNPKKGKTPIYSTSGWSETEARNLVKRLRKQFPKAKIEKHGGA